MYYSIIMLYAGMAISHEGHSAVGIHVRETIQSRATKLTLGLIYICYVNGHENIDPNIYLNIIQVT